LGDVPPAPFPPGFSWINLQGVEARSYVCGFCDQLIASEKGWQSKVPAIYIRVCPSCQRPTFFEGGVATPAVAFGNSVKELPDAVRDLYQQARTSCSASAYTGAVLLLRKLLMHIAVDLKAPENQPFIAYVQYLADAGYVPPNGKAWVDHIRKRGNEANHEIVIMTATDARELIAFSEMLLKFIYEFPKQIPFSPGP
jgi:hypothetical protein